MLVLGTYFLWLVILVLALLLYLLSRALVLVWLPELAKRRYLAPGGWVIYLLFLFITYFVCWDATQEVFGNGFHGRIYWNTLLTGSLDLSWRESARFGLISLTALSILCFSAYVVHSALLRATGRTKLEVQEGVSGNATVLFDGPFGSFVRVVVTLLSVVSSIITIMSYIQ